MFLFIIVFMLFCFVFFKVIQTLSMKSSLISLFLLIILNVVGSSFQIMIPLNLFTMSVAMFLGIPGIVVLFVFYTLSVSYLLFV